MLRFKRGADLDAPFRVVNREPNPTCTWNGCTEGHYGRGYCQRHYHRWYMGQDMDTALREPRVPGVTTERNAYGYVQTWMPDHPGAFGKGWVMEHRLAMERTLGRYLLPGETVHHRNGVRDDNRDTNLELWVTAQPSGQRPSDLVEHARMLLSRYGSDDERTRYA